MIQIGKLGPENNQEMVAMQIYGGGFQIVFRVCNSTQFVLELEASLLQ